MAQQCLQTYRSQNFLQTSCLKHGCLSSKHHMLIPTSSSKWRPEAKSLILGSSVFINSKENPGNSSIYFSLSRMVSHKGPMQSWGHGGGITMTCWISYYLIPGGGGRKPPSLRSGISACDLSSLSEFCHQGRRSWTASVEAVGSTVSDI